MLFRESNNTVYLSLYVHVLSVKTYTDDYSADEVVLGSVSGTSLNFFNTASILYSDILITIFLTEMFLMFFRKRC